MKPWREIAIPHPDVLEGTFLQAEFAADISAVNKGKATNEYQDASAFFQRTFITDGMRLLLSSVALRLNGRGGDPVIQLQTAFGGGKTHTMLAVYHLARRSCGLQDLVGIPALLDQAKLMDVPRAQVAVLDGADLAPGQPWQHGKHKVQTLWGELAWQLGREEALELVKEADHNGTSPGKDVLKTLLERHAPCVILMDELVAYIRQFADGQRLSGGTYDSNLSFIQSLTEAIKLVPNALLLASLPESEIEAGSSTGVAVLRALEKTFGRVQALWKPVATEEAFEIVRRRLFEPIRDNQSRDLVCRAFADAYKSEGTRLPSETQEARYYDRLVQAYPIHPEVFDRLYEDWTTLESFQRTRGVLKLMAKVIYRLWKDQNQDLMILPGSLPLSDGGTRNELTYYLALGWDPVIERDIDGDRAETTELESKEPRFGAVNAARRVARSLFLGSAPAASATHKGIRGMDRARIMLGCVQPGHPSSIFSDALNRLCDRLHHLNSSGDKAQDSTRFWFDTRANLRREMEDRKRRFNEKAEVRGKIAETLKKLAVGMTLFEGQHIFTPHGDVPDDAALRLVFLPPDRFYSKDEHRAAFEGVNEFLRMNGTKPRYRANRLVFVAPDDGSLSRLNDCVRTALAWGAIVDDIKAGRLNIDRLQEEQAKKEAETAQAVVTRATRECYRWILCPVMMSSTDRQPVVEAYPIATSGASVISELERVCRDNELIIETWSAIHLRDRLKELYWKDDRVAVGALAVWEDTLRYLYLPRLKNRGVFERAVQQGVASTDFFGTALGQVDDRYEGFGLGGGHIQLDSSLLLIEPGAAAKYELHLKNLRDEEEGRRQASLQKPKDGSDQTEILLPPVQTGTVQTGTGGTSHQQPTVKSSEFFGTVEVNAATAKSRLVMIADEIIALLAGDPNAAVRVTVSIDAEFPQGASDQLRRAVSENAKSLGFKDGRWE